MKKYLGILESDNVVSFLTKRNLIKQYKQAKDKIMLGQQGGSDLKERQPKGTGIYAFRINRQFRAIGYERENYFIVSHIDNHQ